MFRTRSQHVARDISGRAGSTLLIVVALMGMMAFLGFVFYTFAAQERTNAITLAEGAKVRTSPSIEPDSLFDFALQSVILGPHEANYQSILWGGRHALIPNMYGRDNIPWNGEGISLADNGIGQPVVDMGYTNVANGNQNLLNFVDSAAANGGVKWGANKSIYLSGAYNPSLHLPAPDANYNSPDINSVFLHYDGIASDATGTTVKRVIIPSYLRPQYLRTAGVPTSQWYRASPANQVMRPHPNHVCLDSSGNQLTSGGIVLPRFVSDLDPPNGLPSYQSLGLRRPFTSNSFLPETALNTAPTANLGIWSGGGTNPFDIALDVDTDGDGIMDAILMDLGYPPIRRGDGKLVVPLFAISVRDLNGLLNVNATGNLSGNLNFGAINSTSQLGFRPTGGGNYMPDNLSKSNQGLSTFEINIQRALTANPTDVASNSPEIARQLATFLYVFDPTVNQPGRTITELSNLEWLMLNIGRAKFHLGLAQSLGPMNPIQNAITDMLSGRHGEVSRLRNFLTSLSTIDMPRAGQSVASITFPPGAPDDNGNYNEGEFNNSTRWVNPLDFRGSGQQFQRYSWGPDVQPGVASVDDDGNGVVDDFSEEGWTGSDDVLTPIYGKAPEFYRNGPLLWPAYSGYHSLGSVRWGQNATTGAYSSVLMRGSRSDSLLDDPAESIIDPVLISANYSGAAILNNANSNDTVFGPEEMSFLQGSTADGRLAETRSRLAELMPGNLVASSSAADIRKRLTTVSSDRREFGIATYPIGQLRHTGGTPWETSPQFPPDVNYSGNPNPYRPELFNFLLQNAGSVSPSVKLNVNHFLYYSGGTQYGFAPLPEQTSISDQNATIARQNMARDIYTLLYTLCQGQDVDYRIAPALTPERAKEMAQFAINYVDALDADDIITAFYYDKDLTQAGNGWAAADATDVVYGVERQQLTFTEALGIQVMQRADAGDSKLTIFDDATTDATTGRLYLYFELQNVSPTNAIIASTTATAANVNAGTGGDWRVRLVDTATEKTNYNIVTFLNGLDNPNNRVQIDASGNAYLSAGQSFTVSSQDGTDKSSDGEYRTSDFRWDQALDGNFERIVPATSHDGSVDAVGARVVPKTTTNKTQFPTPKCNLDLVWDYGGAQNRFVLNKPVGFTASVLGVPEVKLILERRAADGSANGAWVPVDKTQSIKFATNQVTPPPTDVATPPKVMSASNRKGNGVSDSPLARSSESLRTASLNVASTNSTSTIWQWQLDRDFASLAELMLIPVYGPEDVTNGRLTNSEFYFDTANNLYYPTIAAARFLRPDNPDLTQNGTANTGNRWYRLFDFLEVANRSHQHQAIQGISPSGAVTWGIANPVLGTPATFAFNGTPGTTANTAANPINTSGNDNFPLPEPFKLPLYYGWPRTHGLVNLNMVRHPHALAALIDDDQLIQDQRYTGGTSPNLYSTDEGINRDWWVRFLMARESRATNQVVDPVTGLFVPGTANSRPFRAFDSVGVAALNTTDSPLENTLLRSLPFDNPLNKSGERRRLFEVGTSGEHFGDPQNEVVSNALHPSARYRILSKLMNNTTTRSNTFAIYVTVQYYEAAEVPTDTSGVNAIRIGGKLDDAPIHRGFFVVDRTSAIEQMKVLSANGAPPVVSSTTFTFKPDTDKTGQRGNMTGIRWKDLVIFRQTLN